MLGWRQGVTGRLIAAGLTGMVGVLGQAGCGGGPPPAPAPVAQEVVPRHWDQVCNVVHTRPATIRISELFDTTGLGQTLAEVGIKPLPLAPPWPLYDFITRYDARGHAVASGTWDATVEPAIAAALEAELKGRIRSLPGLLESAGFRSQVRFARRITFDVTGPVACMPHMVHRDGQRAVGLPDDVTTWGGSVYVREGDRTTAVVRIHIGKDGSVLRVEDVKGEPATLARTREVIRGLVFEPALENGVPVEGELLQAFRFRESGGRPAG